MGEGEQEWQIFAVKDLLFLSALEDAPRETKKTHYSIQLFRQLPHISERNHSVALCCLVDHLAPSKKKKFGPRILCPPWSLDEKKVAAEAAAANPPRQAKCDLYSSTPSHQLSSLVFLFSAQLDDIIVIIIIIGLVFRIRGESVCVGGPMSTNKSASPRCSSNIGGSSNMV